MCAARKVFFGVNLLWWREPKLRHWGTSISASRGSGELAAYSGVLTLAQTAATGSLRAWAAQAEAEVERSEGEGEAQGRPVLGWAICRRLGVSAAGRPGVLWVTRRRVCTAGWYGGAGACEGRAVEAPAGVTRRLAGGTARGGIVMVVPAFFWSCSVMEIEAASLSAGLSVRRAGAGCVFAKIEHCS